MTCAARWASALLDRVRVVGVTSSTLACAFIVSHTLFHKALHFLQQSRVQRIEAEAGQFNRHRYANGNPYTFTYSDGRQASERFVEQHRTHMEAGNGAVYEPVRPVAIAVTAAMAAPVLVEVGMAAMASPGAVSAATSIAADIAGVTGVGGAGVAVSRALSAEGRALVNSRPVGKRT